MSEGQISSQRPSFNPRESFQAGNTIAEQVISNQMFKLMLKDEVENLVKKTKIQQEEKQETNNEPVVSLEKLLDEIGDQLVLIARTEAVKQVKETEKFLSEMYEHKVKELEDKFDEMMEDKVKEFEERIERARAISQAEISFMGPGRSPLRNIQLGENPNEVSQICKRAELKEKILNSTTMRSCHNIDTCQSFLSDSFGSDPTLEKLTERMKQIEENFKHEVKTTTLKITGIKTQCRADLDTTEAAIKEQINSGFQGIWNVISNLEKRMMV